MGNKKDKTKVFMLQHPKWTITHYLGHSMQLKVELDAKLSSTVS